MPQDNIEAIKQKIDVIDLLQEYIQFKPAGTGSFKALCPFHHEKTPSFVASRDKQIWHCFGCGEGGDIFGFVMKMEGLEFPEALRLLAKKAGVQLQYQDPALQNQRTKLQDICKAATVFYHKLLVDHPKVQPVRDYLKKRGVSQESIESWQLGYAPDDWETLNNYLKKKFKEEDIFLAGLTIKKDRGVGYIDRFRHRLMFPINDLHGNAIGFGGRWLGKDEKMAKYINNPQTLLYNKSQVLYGIDKAKQEIKREKLAVIVEGYMDCLASHQAGVINVVASSGTALTPDQVRILKRYSPNLAFAFDQDLAGDTAARRGIEVAWQEEMNTKVILISGAKDPDELIKKDPSAWKKSIAASKSVIEYYFETTLKGADLTQVEDKKKVARSLLSIISKLADVVEQAHYIQKLSQVLSVEEMVLRDKLKQLMSKEKTTSRPVEPGHALPVQTRADAISESIVGLALAFPDQVNYIFDHLPPENLSSAKAQELYKLMIIYYTENHNFNSETFISQGLADKKELASYAGILSLKYYDIFRDIDGESLRQEIQNSIISLQKNYIQQHLKVVEQQLRAAETSGDKRKIEELSRQFSTLVNDLKQTG